MTTKIEKSMEILKFIEEPTYIQMMAIAKDLNCNVRQVYRGLERLRTKVKEESILVQKLKEMQSNMSIAYQFYRKKTKPFEQPSIKELKAIKDIEVFLMEDLNGEIV